LPNAEGRAQTIDMKKITLGMFGLIAVLAVAVAAVAVIACKRGAKAQTNFIPGSGSGGDVYGIILQLADADDPGNESWKKIDDVLKATPTYLNTSRSSVYRVRRFNEGVPDGSEDDGKLSKEHLLFDQDALTKDLDKDHRKFSGYAFQIGVGRIQSYDTLGSKVTMPQGRVKLNEIRESRKMVEEINNILSPEPTPTPTPTPTPGP
jgi:hypothetical protein